MQANLVVLRLHVCKSGPSGPRESFRCSLRGFSPAGPKGPKIHAMDAAINGRSSTTSAGKHA